MRFRIAPEVFDNSPDYFVGVVVATDIDNWVIDDSIASDFTKEQEVVRSFLATHPLDNLPAVTVWRDAMRKSNIDPTRYASAIESLLCRIQGNDTIPHINPAVDLANTVSLRYRLPIGAHDIDRLRGDIEVRLSREGDIFTPRGNSEPEAVPAGEIVYVDDLEVRTRRWVWHLGDKGKVVEASRCVFFPIDGMRGVTEDQTRAATAELAATLSARLGARTQQFFVDRDHPEIDLGVDPHVYHDAIDRLLTRGIVDVLPTKVELERRLHQGSPIRIYLGVDPTSPVIHLGHAVQIRKLRQFQDLGHRVILLIGDFTGRIGDPTDKSAMRVQLTKEQAMENATTYTNQAAKILDFNSTTNPIEVRFNAEWWDPLTARDMIELAAYFTAQQMLQREMFQKRLEENKPIGLHEFLYPLLQGYDSVALDVDAELGGTDQTFNMLCGRTLVKAIEGKDKYVLTGPLLEGTDGRKMSKSYGNVIGVNDPPYDMYGKIMSLRDELIVRYFELLTDVPEADLDQMAQQLAEGSVNPMMFKKRLAFDITTQYHCAEAAKEAAERFEREVQRREVPEEMPTIQLEHGGDWPIIDLLVMTNLATSKGDARRLVEQGAIQVDGNKIVDPRASVSVAEGMVVRGRKRQYARLSV